MQPQQTTDYEKFKILTSNRKVSKSHVRSLVRSMEENPGLFEFRPILVNKDMFIIDGQHRFTAAQQLGMPIWYVMAPDMTIKDTQAMNMNQRNWTPVDFARSYSFLGLKPYQDYVKFREDYPHFEHTVIMNLLTGYTSASGGSLTQQKFKAGELKIEDLPESRQVADQLEEIYETVRPVMAATSASSLMTAAVRMIRHPEYNHEQFMRHLKQVNEIKYRPNVKEYLRDLEDIYNFYKQNKTRFL